MFSPLVYIASSIYIYAFVPQSGRFNHSPRIYQPFFLLRLRIGLLQEAYCVLSTIYLNDTLIF